MFVTNFIFREHEQSSFNQISGIIQVTMQKDALLNFWENSLIITVIY